MPCIQIWSGLLTLGTRYFKAALTIRTWPRRAADWRDWDRRV